MTESTTILIVGAGPVGLSAALALRQAGVAVRIVDAGNGVDKRMRASTFHPPTLDMIDSLGLASQLIERGLTAPHFQMRQHESNEHVTFDLSAIDDATAHPYRLQIEQHRYCSIAIDALSKLGVDVEFGNALESITTDETGATAHLGDAEVRADWIVGADGANSAVRKSLGLDYGGKTYTHSSVLVSVDFPFHEYLDDLSSVTYCWSERGPFSLLRLRKIWRASLYPGIEDLDAAADEGRVREWLAYIHPAARDAEIMDVNPYRVHERCVEKFRVGRVLLAGDAAHLNPPSGGMGMNGGIHDAINLSEKLLEVIGGAADSVLDRYSRQRQTLVSKRIIPQASANRARMATMDKAVQLERLAERRQIAADPAANRDFLLLSSMITSVREAQEID
jgi:2-polyprenyl-6-methoxyphenol hydroxylase-like FAD-dependent oxidoreductase